MKTIQERVELMRKEIDAGVEYAEALRRMNATPIVDDDYPEMRFRYNSAARRLIDAFRANGKLLL